MHKGILETAGEGRRKERDSRTEKGMEGEKGRREGGVRVGGGEGVRAREEGG